MPDTVVKGSRKTHAPKARPAGFLAGGGEMGRRMRALDWSKTPLGDVDRWPATLRTAVRILLSARQPMFLFWGERAATLYNDAAKGVVASKHPRILGQPAAAAWQDLWHAVGGRVEALRKANEAAYDDAVMLPLESGGTTQPARFAISYSPVAEDDGIAGGILCILNETESFHEAVIDLSSELDLEVLLQKVTDAATRMTRARFGAFFYNSRTDKGEAYQLYSLSGADRGAVEKLGMPRATTLFKPTFDGGASIRLDDVTKDARYGKNAPHHGMPAGHLPVRSYLAVPVVSRTSEVLGALFFGHPEPGMFDERAERNARAIAAHAAVAIDNANLFSIARSEIEERSRVEAALRDSEGLYRDAVDGLARTRDELAEQVDVFKGLHEMATRLATIGDEDEALQAILETAVALQHGDSGSLDLYDRAQDTLVVKATVGFDKRAAREMGPANLVPGAVHSTPITTRGGSGLGVLSVHFREPHDLSPREEQLGEVCARHAADAIEHHRSRQALEESERLYRAIGESINYGVWVCDAQGDAVYVSESFLKLTGLDRDSYARSIWTACLHPDDTERVRAQWKETIAAGRDWEAQVQVKTATGAYRAILSRGVAIRDDAGRITGWAGMNLDIDRLKRVENELRELDQRKNEFLATLAHELRNPLAPIRNGLEIMRLGRGNPGMVEQARTMMERQLHQMVRLVDDLLDVSRVSRGKIELRKARMELSAALANAMETAKPLVDHNGQLLVANMPTTPIPLDGDLTRLSQVFANLLNNAAKYSERGGRIEIDVRPAGDAVEVRVRDDGIGIPKEALGRIFDIFTQVERSLEKARGGLGIGLSIARRLVEMHGGTITASSDGPGKGSEFLVRLPMATSAPAQERRTPVEEASRLRRRVLIADDNIDAASSLSLMLQVMGHDVRVAHDGLEALNVVETFTPDAVLLDIGMPGLNGYEACRKLREKSATSSTYIVALTGWGQEEDRKRSREFGFDQHLVKPVEPRTLEAILARLGKA